MVVDFARQVLGTEEVNSSEFDRSTRHPVIDLMPDQREISDMGGTMRLGLYPCVLQPGTMAAEAYGVPQVQERHRHRFEFNNAYRESLGNAGMRFSGLSPDGRLVEIAELVDHPFMVATQFHPEFLSRPNRPHPLFVAFLKAVKEKAGLAIVDVSSDVAVDSASAAGSGLIAPSTARKSSILTAVFCQGSFGSQKLKAIHRSRLLQANIA